MYAGIPRKPVKYTEADKENIFELIKTLNMGGRGGVHDIVGCAITQYDYFKQRMEEANNG